MLLVLGFAANAQRNLKFSILVFNPAIDTNIVTGSITSPYYIIKNISSTAADSVAKGDSIHLKTPTNFISDIGIIIPSQSLKKDSFLVLNSTTVTGGYSVPFADIKTLLNSSFGYVYSPFIANTQYYWYAFLDTVIAGPGNPAIASVERIADTQRIWINKTTGINEVAFKNAESLNTYPNPALNELNFNYNFTDNNNAVVRIVDLVGHSLLVKEFENLSGERKINLDISNLQRGIYFMMLEVGDKTMLSKFNVQK